MTGWDGRSGGTDYSHWGTDNPTPEQKAKRQRDRETLADSGSEFVADALEELERDRP